MARNCDSYWRWREREAKEEQRRLKERSEKENERVLRHTLQPLKEVWLTIGMEKVDTHKGVTVKALLDSGAIGMFVDRDFKENEEFRLERLDTPSKVTNVDRTDNIGGRITYEVECNIYYRGHVKWM